MLALVLSNLALAALLAFVLKQHAAERSDLLNRIQAPELAVQREFVKDAEPGPPGVPPDDDAAYWDAVEQRETGATYNLRDLLPAD